MAVGISHCLQVLLLCVGTIVGTGRTVQEKTPFPCRDTYDDSEISDWVARHLKGFEGGKEPPQLLLLLGGSGAGKGTFVEKWKALDRGGAPKHPLEGFVFHGLDEYLQYVPDYQKTIEDNDNVYKDAADACYGGAAIPAAKRAQEEIISKKMNLIYEETGKNFDRIKQRVLPPFLDANYRITVVLVHNHAEVAIKRCADRFQKTGRYAPDDYIKGSFKNNLDTYDALKAMDGLLEFAYCNNAGAKMQCWKDGRTDLTPLIPPKLFDEGEPIRINAKAEL